MSNIPAFHVYSIISRKDQSRGDRFVEIGAAWWSKNGDTINLTLDALPHASNRVVLVPHKPKEKD